MKPGLLSAGLFLSYASTKNRALRLVRKPKVLVFTMLGLASVVGSNARLVMHGLAAGKRSPPALVGHGITAMASIGFAAFALVMLAAAWIFGGSKVALQYTEAEVAFFFSGPVSRRALVHYKLVRTLLGSAVFAPLLALFSRRGQHPLLYALGVFFALSIFALHRIASSFTRVSLREHGVSGLRWRLITLALVLGVFGFFLALFAKTAATLPPLDPAHFKGWITAMVIWAETHEQAISWSLLPLSAPIRLMMARSSLDVLTALPVATAVLAGHYLWAVSSSVSFEESAAEESAKNARALEARRTGAVRIARRSPLFTLGETGRPWVALLWKNLSIDGSMSRRQLRLILVAVLVAPALIMTLGKHPGDGWARGIAIILLVIAFVLALIGPMAARSDLRGDVDKMEVLRSYPLSGRDAVLGSVASPIVLLVAFEVALVLAGELVMAFAVRRPGDLGRAIGVGVASICFLPTLTACGVVLQNLLVLHFPSWAKAGDTERGMEASGRRLVQLLAALVLIALVVTPGAIAMMIGVLAFTHFLGVNGGIAIGGLLASFALSGIAWLGIALAARAFDAFDVTETQ